jgi:beta-mannanase
LKSFAASTAAYKKTVYLRPAWEMNLAFDGVHNTPASFVAMWRHVHDIFSAQGASNVRWYWCPNAPKSSAEVSWSTFYPGDAYVDVVGFDSYNWGTTQSWSSWQSMHTTFAAAYSRLNALTRKPIVVGETSSVEQGGNKAAWITAGFADIPVSFPRIAAVLWFDERRQPQDWRITSSKASLGAYSTVANSPAWNTPFGVALAASR